MEDAVLREAEDDAEAEDNAEADNDADAEAEVEAVTEALTEVEADDDAARCTEEVRGRVVAAFLQSLKRVSTCGRVA